MIFSPAGGRPLPKREKLTMMAGRRKARSFCCPVREGLRPLFCHDIIHEEKGEQYAKNKAFLLRLAECRRALFDL